MRRPGSGCAGRDGRELREGRVGRDSRYGRDRGERGVALLLALFVVFLLSLALALVGLSLQLRMRLVQKESRDLRLELLTDAALSEALANLAQDRSFTGLAEHPFGGGTLASHLQPQGVNLYSVLATAGYGGRLRAIQATVHSGDGTTEVVAWRRLDLVTGGAGGTGDAGGTGPGGGAVAPVHP